MEGNDRSELNNRFARAVERITAQTYYSILEEWTAKELTTLQVRILEVLLTNGPARMGELAGSLGHNLSAATTLMDRLVDKGLTHRVPDPNDRRVVLCELTPKGRATMEHLRGMTKETVTQIAAKADVGQMEAMIQGLELLQQHWDQTREQSHPP